MNTQLSASAPDEARSQADVPPERARANGRGDLGRRLREIRARIVASDEHLLTWDEIESELAARRRS